MAFSFFSNAQVLMINRGTLIDGVQFLQTGRRAILRLASLWILVFSIILFVSAPSFAESRSYRFNPQDKIRLKLLEWRPQTGEYFEWSALTGEYTINSDGRLSLPLVGQFQAAGLSSQELEAEISSRLQARTGLVARPDASVEIVQFRPFYIAGAVERQGEHPYRPGLNVLQAITMAGGIRRVEGQSTWRLQHDLLDSGGELAILSFERAALLARRARLQAELDGNTEIAFPENVAKGAQAATLTQLLRQEQAIFEVRRRQVSNQVQMLQKALVLLNEEIENTKAKIVTESRQLQLTGNQLKNMQSLSERGLARTPQVLELERIMAQIEGRRLELESSILRARQDLNKTERNINELNDQYHNAAATELREVGEKIEKVEQRIATTEHLVHDMEAMSPELAMSVNQNAMAQPIITIMRDTDGRTIEMPATETTKVQPGDVVRLEIPLVSCALGDCKDSRMIQ